MLAGFLLATPNSTYAKVEETVNANKCVISGEVSLPKGIKAAKNMKLTLVHSKENSLSTIQASIIKVNDSFKKNINFTIADARKVQDKIYLKNGMKADSDIAINLLNGFI